MFKAMIMVLFLLCPVIMPLMFVSASHSVRVPALSAPKAHRDQAYSISQPIPNDPGSGGGGEDDI
jgi:hypothetical protein